MTRPLADVVIVGDGPAGSALAHACATRGVSVCIVGSGTAWPATYGCWVDDLEPAVAELARPGDDTGSVFDVVVPQIDVVTDGRVSLDRPYAILANEHLRSGFEAGTAEFVTGRVVRVQRTGWRRAVLLADGSRLDARLVIDATGWPSAITGELKGPPVAWQSAIGVVLAEPPSGDLGVATLMDLGGVRSPDGMRSSIGPAGVSSFAYAVPVHDGWLVEETVLASRTAIEPIALLARLAARLGRHPDALLETAVRREFVRVPMGVPIAAELPVVPFGAAAGYLHPATGYSVAASLRAVPRVADAIAEGVASASGTSPVDEEAVWSAVWPTSLRRTRVFHDLGLRMLLRLEAPALAEFFDTFFALPTDRWSTFLRIDAPPADTATVMAEVFRSSSWSLRRRLAGGNPAALGRLLRP